MRANHMLLTSVAIHPNFGRPLAICEQDQPKHQNGLLLQAIQFYQPPMSEQARYCQPPR